VTRAGPIVACGTGQAAQGCHLSVLDSTLIPARAVIPAPVVIPAIVIPAIVIPAEAGIQGVQEAERVPRKAREPWIPASAGMTAA
jgi:hypothetical protein